MQVERVDNPTTDSLRIMLIEDSDTDVYLIHRAARELAYELDVEHFAMAPDVLVRLDDLSKPVPDGVLLDLNLPGGSGLDLLQSIRRHRQLAAVPVIIMTSSVSPYDREAAHRLGVEGYLLKASNYAQFVEAVGLALNLIRDAQGQADPTRA